MAFFAVKTIDLREFRGIRELEKPITLGSFNVLVGRNNAGKSAVLEALYLLSKPFRGYLTKPYGKDIYEFISAMHGVSSALVYGHEGKASITYSFRNKVESNFERLVVDGITRNDVRVSVSGMSIVLDTKGVIEVRVDGNGVVPDFESFKDFLGSVGVDSETNELCLYIPNNTNAYNAIAGFVLEDGVWSWIEKRGLHRRVVRDLVEPSVSDKFTEVTIRRDRLCLRKEVREDIGPLYVDVNSIGEGVKRAVLAYLAIEYLNPRIVLWDDIEVAAHPSLLESMLRWLSESKRQVVLATHSIDVLYSLTQIRPRDARVIVLSKSSEDIVSHKEMDLARLSDYLDGGVDIRKLVEGFSS